MQSLILIALMQAAMGEPAQPAADAEPAATETPAAEAAPRTERRRVCRDPGAATGGRLTARRCTWEEVVIEPEPEETPASDQPATAEGAPPAQEGSGAQ